jgi:hypothetical protein
MFFLDHDDRTVEVVAPSFCRWIDEFCAVAPHWANVGLGGMRTCAVAPAGVEGEVWYI